MVLKVKSSLMMDKETWKQIKLEAIKNDMEIGEFIEHLFRRSKK